MNKKTMLLLRLRFACILLASAFSIYQPGIPPQCFDDYR